MSILARAIYNPSGSIGSTSSSSTDNAVPRYDGTTGLLLQNSGVTIDDSNNVTVPGNLVVTGDLTINGTTTTVNTATLDVEDKNILVNKGGTTAGAAGSGLNIEGDTAAVVGYLRAATDTANLEFKAPTGSILTVDVNANKTLTVAGALNIEADSMINQDVTSDADVTFATLTVNNSGIHILDTNASHDLILAVGSDLTADRTLTFTTGDAARIITLSGNPTLNDWFNQEVKTTSSPTFVALNTSGATPLILTNGQAVNIAVTSQTTGATTLTIPDFASVVDEFTFKTKAQTMANKTLTAPVISAGLTASGSASNDFSSSTGAFQTSSGANTFNGAVTINDATTPSVTTASGKTNTGYFQVNGKTSGALKITTADAAAQTITLSLAAQTVGAATLTIPDMANTNKTLAWLESPAFTTPNLGTPSAGVLTNCSGTADNLTSGITKALKSATTTVDVSAATAPSTGQVLKATSSTTATWQTLSTSGFTNVVVQTFTANGTYTPTSGMAYCIVEAVGGGGGGGGSAGSGGTAGVGGSGGGGGYARKRLTASDIGASKAVAIGAAGAGGSAGNNAGGSGGSTTLGSTLVVAAGGTGGSGSAGAAGTNGAGGGAGGAGTTGDLLITGQTGGNGYYINAAFLWRGAGGNSGGGFGLGGPAIVKEIGTGTTAGAAATGYGGGGTGGITYTSSDVAGGAGTAGYMIITEYIS